MSNTFSKMNLKKFLSTQLSICMSNQEKPIPGCIRAIICKTLNHFGFLDEIVIFVKIITFSLICFFYLVSKPAPYWEGKAVVNGEFKDLKLTDFKGMSMKWYISIFFIRD